LSTGSSYNRQEKVRDGATGDLGWIDVGKTKHHACVIDPDCKIVFSQKVAND
jgi:hypothetical protein